MNATAPREVEIHATAPREVEIRSLAGESWVCLVPEGDRASVADLRAALALSAPPAVRGTDDDEVQPRRWLLFASGERLEEQSTLPPSDGERLRVHVAPAVKLASVGHDTEAPDSPTRTISPPAMTQSGATTVAGGSPRGHSFGGWTPALLLLAVLATVLTLAGTTYAIPTPHGGATSASPSANGPPREPTPRRLLGMATTGAKTALATVGVNTTKLSLVASHAKAKNSTASAEAPLLRVAPPMLGAPPATRPLLLGLSLSVAMQTARSGANVSAAEAPNASDAWQLERLLWRATYGGAADGAHPPAGRAHEPEAQPAADVLAKRSTS